MSYVAERREEEKERRRTEILEAAEALYAEKGWDAVTMDAVARSARLSRALLYVYFSDKEDLLFGVGQRAMRVLRDRFQTALASHARGIDQVDAIGRAYMAYAIEFPHYFDACMRFQAHSMAPQPGSNEGACALEGDQVLALVVRAIQNGVADGSVRQDVGDPMLLAVSLWGFTHGATQLVAKKSGDLAHHDVHPGQLTEYVFGFLRQSLSSRQ